MRLSVAAIAASSSTVHSFFSLGCPDGNVSGNSPKELEDSEELILFLGLDDNENMSMLLICGEFIVSVISSSVSLLELENTSSSSGGFSLASMASLNALTFLIKVAYCSVISSLKYGIIHFITAQCNSTPASVESAVLICILSSCGIPSNFNVAAIAVAAPITAARAWSTPGNLGASLTGGGVGDIFSLRCTKLSG